MPIEINGNLCLLKIGMAKIVHTVLIVQSHLFSDNFSNACYEWLFKSHLSGCFGWFLPQINFCGFLLTPESRDTMLISEMMLPKIHLTVWNFYNI